jgi:tripartite-type tricarboxylate transporter receptor subunit TctC
MYRAASFAISAGILLQAFATGQAGAESYPARPIRLVVPYVTGGGTDVSARVIANGLRDEFGQTVVVDNRAGAGSTVGTNIVAKSLPDGYTLLYNNISLAFNPFLYKQLPYDALKDLAPISLVAEQPYIVVVRPSQQINSMTELAALARARPGQITYASAGMGSGIHLAAELLMLKSNIKLTQVPYKGTGPVLIALIGGEVNMTVSTLASALPYVKEGRLRALGITSLQRSRLAPEIPTLIEAGVPGYVHNTWYGLLAPALTPRPVIDRLNAAARKVLLSSATTGVFESQGMDATPSSPAQFAAYLRTETEKWREVARAANIQPQ